MLSVIPPSNPFHTRCHTSWRRAGTTPGYIDVEALTASAIGRLSISRSSKTLDCCAESSSFQFEYHVLPFAFCSALVIAFQSLRHTYPNSEYESGKVSCKQERALLYRPATLVVALT